MKVELLFVNEETQGIFFKKSDIKTETDADLIAHYVRMAMNEQCTGTDFNALDILKIIKNTKEAYIGFFVELIEDKPNPYNKLPMKKPEIFMIKATVKEFNNSKEKSNNMDIKLYHEIMAEYDK